MILFNQTFNDIQIIIVLKKNSDFKNIKIASKYKLLSKKIEILTLIHKWEANFYKIINRLKGKFTIFLDEFFDLQKDELFKIYNLTKGKINNIYKYFTNNNHSLYLIRSKVLKDIYDIKINFNNFQEIINYVYALPPLNFNYLPICYCPNNKYTSLCYTSMLSVLSSKGFNSYILFFIIIPNDFAEQNIKFLETLYEQYDYFNITFIKMDDRYDNAFTSNYLTIHAYYRYSLGELIPNLNKIIYLDADTICLGDLSNFYNLNFEGKVILGRILQSNTINNSEYYSINSGILLLNLKEMRKIKFEKLVLNYLKKGFGYKNLGKQVIRNKWTDLHTVDQALINMYFYEFIGLFPPKYNGLSFNYEQTVKFNKDSGHLYDDNYLYYSFKYPSIKHFSGSKKDIFFKDDWTNFARKSKYFLQISDNLSNIYNYSFKYL